MAFKIAYKVWATEKKGKTVAPSVAKTSFTELEEKASIFKRLVQETVIRAGLLPTAPYN